MKIACIPLKPFSRFHFGRLKLDHNLALSDTGLYAHSDTLFAALVNSYSKSNGGAEDFIKCFEEDKLKISSLFYYVQKENVQVHFLPKPVFLSLNVPKSEDGSHKKINKIQFVSLAVWQNGFEIDNWLNTSKYQIIGNFVMTTQEFQSLGISDDFVISIVVSTPKSPKRISQNESIYYQSDIEVGGTTDVKVGWYFMYQADGENESALKLATNIMAYSGIGGEINNMGRTISHKPTFKSLNLQFKNEITGYCNLSLLNPIDQSQFDKVKYYRTSLRGGRSKFQGSEYARVVRMINEGALLNSDNVKGQLVKLGNDEQDRTIYRNGIPFIIPVSYVQ